MSFITGEPSFHETQAEMVMASETKLVTVVTTDMRNFTYHSKQHDRETEDEFLKRFDILCDIVRDFHNMTMYHARTHDKQKEAVALSTGDGVILTFQDNAHAATAYKTVLDLQTAYIPFFREANKLMGERRQSTSLGYGIGVHTGRVTIRRYQSYNQPGAVNTMILGDALNIASRLESLTKDHPGCGAMISEDTYDALVQQMGQDCVRDFVDYQIHHVRGYRALRLYGIGVPSITS